MKSEEGADLLAAALDYAKRGIKVFPLCPRGKEPLTEHGHKNATADEAQIREWWTKWPDANIGAPAGVNHRTVLDFDSDSPEELFELAGRYGIVDAVPMVKTGKGRQLYFDAVEGLGPFVRVAGEPVDVRSGESYTILPPSVHPNGREYRWVVPLCDPLPKMPAATLEKLKAGIAAKVPAVVSVEGAEILEGQRNAELARIAGKLRRVGASEGAILAQLKETNATRCRPPLPDSELDAIARSIARYEPAPEPMPEVAVGSLQEAILVLKTVLEHPDPFFHPALILGAAQDHIIGLLHSVFYIVFGGGPDTGKGTANAAAMALTRNGIVLGGASGPYLRDTLGGGRAIAISETETLLKENPQLLAIIRNGNRRTTAKVGLKIPAGKGWTNETVDTFGFKTLDFHDRLDAHVLGRALQFEMVQSKDLDVAMDAEYIRERLAPVRAWIAQRAEAAHLEGWTAEEVREVWDSKAFRARVKTFRNAWGRHGIIAAYLLLVNDIFELDLESTIRELMDAREPEISPVAQEVQDAILELAGENPRPDLELRTQDDILKRVNETRTILNLRPLTSITGALRELDFSAKAGNWISAKKNRSGPNRGKAVILPYERIRSWQVEPVREKSASGEVSSSFESSPPGEAILAVQTILRELCADGHDAVLEDVLRVSQERGIAPERAKGILKRMRTDGDLYEPSPGVYRLTENLR